MGLPTNSPNDTFSILPHSKTPDQKFNFGATVTNLDLNSISPTNIDALRTAIWTHKVLIVKGQPNLTPQNHWSLVTRLDPSAPQVHSHGTTATFNAKGGVLTKGRPIIGIPGAENVRLIGKGYQGADHHGIKDLTISKCLTHLDFHAEVQPPGAFEKGHTRFQRWHIDAPLYARDPAWFTTLRAVKLPSAEARVTIDWDDGSGYSMEARAGLTAFFSTSQLYAMLSEEEQRMADHSWVEYAPHPYMWIGDCRANSNGLGLRTEGMEKGVDELGGYDEKDIKRVGTCHKSHVHTNLLLRSILSSGSTHTPTKKPFKSTGSAPISCSSAPL
jgi:alpha-ketoglutarate-dependent taurine dioxygenase